MTTAPVSKFHILAALPSELLEKVLEHLSLSEIVNTALTSKEVYHLVNQSKRLSERKAITYNANLFLRYGELLLSDSELKMISFDPDCQVSVRAYRTSVLGLRMIKSKCEAEPATLFSHKTPTQFNALSHAMIHNKDIKLLELLLSSDALPQLTQESLDAIAKFLASQDNLLLLDTLSKYPCFLNISSQAFSDLCFYQGIVKQNAPLFHLLVTSPCFQRLSYQEYFHLINFTILGLKEHFLILVNLERFQEIQLRELNKMFEKAFLSNTPEIFTFVLDCPCFQAIDYVTISRAFQLTCHENHNEGIAALLNYPRICEIAAFSVGHCFMSLSSHNSQHLLPFSAATFFDRIQAGDLLAGLKRIIGHRNAAALNSILSKNHLPLMI